ncbi:uncharacterized protein Dwil_GK15965 [Drosophila willistoni]|uniref:Uncharacterized protein n=1 Tax=Drosophila willistoni TaxID=7260 RepID=B4MS89_DROWI|nr:uncharacterized protein LOC6640819 [Drosophila willistoni]EDW74978.2 uncharacterized protein Dwil_GK15965 [Drosophila willistoni]
MRPIWESAARPLFVRSVWQETIGRRHFILDYEPRQRQRWKRQKAKRGESQQQTQSCEYYDQTIEDSVEYLDEYLLLDATKLTLQQQQQQPLQGGRMNNSSSSSKDQRGHHTSRQAKRRAWLLSRGKTYHSDHYHNHNQLSDHQSRRSSLQDTSTLSMTANNPEERLAERVLNWLDLAGRTDIVKSPTALAPPLTNSAQVGTRTANQKYHHHHRHNHRSVSLKRIATAAAHNYNHNQRATTARKPIKQQQQLPPPAATTTNHNQSANSGNHLNPNAKPITIIFNKEGIPVRLNRPARNIDLCAMSNSASTTRRLAGQLASARLYNGGVSTPSITEETLRTPPQSSRGLNSTAASHSLDSRKQLHIFMPSLPKKGLLNGANCSEDGLSTSFSELCQL